MSLKNGKDEGRHQEGRLSLFRHMSIISRLIALYTLSAFLILTVTNAVIYWEVVKNREQRCDLYIRDEINVLRAVLRGPNSEKEFAREIELEHVERKNIIHYTRVLDAQNHILMEDPQMETLIPPTVFPPARQDYVTHEARVKFRARNGNLYILKAIRTDIGGFGGKGKVLQIAMDVSDLDVFFAECRRKLISMLVLGVLASALAGTILSRRGLRPLSKITETTLRITASRLNERIDPKRWPRELFSLAVAFDSMLDRLEAAITGLSHYSANLAHELRTPINNLMVEADLALSRPRTADEYTKVIGSSMEEYARLSRIIDSLLFLARIENAQTDLHIALVNVGKEIDDLAEFYSAVISDKGIRFERTGEASLHADPVLFRRALANLIANAVNHTASEGEITVSVLQNGDRSVEVSVSDTGCGIAGEDLPHIFKRFYRGAAASRPEAHGSGLGLAIVKSIMDLHGGVVEIRSELTKGTDATMRFIPNG